MIDMGYLFKEIESADEPISDSEIDFLQVEYASRCMSGEGQVADQGTIAHRTVSIFLMCRKIDPSTIEGKPFEEQHLKNGYVYGFGGSVYTCHKCQSEMMGRIHAYPPYCDSTYEEWACPVCNKGGFGMSV
jgi:hypothetical protein